MTGSRVQKIKKRARIAEAEYINGYCMEHREEVAWAVDSFPRDGNFMSRCNLLREAILKTREQ